MELKPLGSTGVMVSEIGLGTWNFRGGPEVIQRSLDLGGTLVDTAEVYRTEENVARGIRGRRGQCFIATKVSGENLRYKDVLKAADASLRRLETDYIDLYQVHWPNSRVPIGGTMRAMAELVAGGKVRYVGVSNFSVRELREAQEALGEYPIVSNQVLYNIFSREIERELVPYCQEHRVTVMAYSPWPRATWKRSCAPDQSSLASWARCARPRPRPAPKSCSTGASTTPWLSRYPRPTGSSGWRRTAPPRAGA